MTQTPKKPDAMIAPAIQQQLEQIVDTHWCSGCENIGGRCRACIKRLGWAIFALGQSLQREQDAPYLQHKPDCVSYRCQNCQQRAWLHDRAEDIDGVTCIQSGQQFTPRTDCTCGLAAIRHGRTP